MPPLNEGDTVIMDILPAHKIAAVRKIIEKADARLLYLPPYSPDLNPIEMMFAKMRALLRKLKERTIEQLWDRIGTVLDELTPQECSNYFRHDGYDAR